MEIASRCFREAAKEKGSRGKPDDHEKAVQT